MRSWKLASAAPLALWAVIAGAFWISGSTDASAGSGRAPVVEHHNLAGAKPAATPANRILVRLQDDEDDRGVRETTRAHGGHVARTGGKGRLRVIELPAGSDGMALLAALRADPKVAAAAFDLRVSAFELPNDPGYPRQWHLQDTAGGINAQAAWDTTAVRGQGVVVAVIDTGVAYENFTSAGSLGPKVFGKAPDLAGVTIIAPWDFVEGDSHANDENGHGTHVAGTIAQATNNGYGVAGVSRASIMPLRVLDFTGSGYASDLIDAIYYASDNGARVINMSLGFTGTGSANGGGEYCSEVVGLKEALDYADAKGVTVVAAAGNDGAATVSCPAAYSTVIAVGATRLDTAVTFYSNTGATLDVVAPGGDPNVDQDGDGYSDQVLQETYCLNYVYLFLSGRYDQFCEVLYSGTSMATPHVVGIAALLIGDLATLSPGQVRTILQSTARERGPAGWDSQYGWGQVDAAAALASLHGVPPPPPPPGPTPTPRPAPTPGASALTATVLSATSIRLDWTDSATGESGFKIERSADGVTFSQVAIAGAGVTTHTSLSLSPGATYWFRVRSYDANGNSPWSDVVTATTRPPPAAPSGLTATGASSSSIRLDWVDNSGSEQGFRIERSADGATWTQVMQTVANAVSWTNTFLSPGVTYQYRVRAYDGTALSAWSNTAAGATFAAPAAPTGLAGVAVNTTTIRLTWTDTSANEQGFKIERSVDGVTWIQAGTAMTNTTSFANYSLSPGASYFFRVRAYEGAINGDFSTTATVATLPPPSAPANLSATALSNASIRLNWTDTSAYEQGFKIERSLDGAAWTQVGSVTANTVTYTNSLLSPGVTYFFRLRAYEGATNGGYSANASAATFPPPAAPANLLATPLGSASIRLNWADASSTENGFKVERSIDGTTWTQVATVLANTTAWTNTMLAPSMSYQYRVRAYEGTVSSDPSNVATAATFALPSAPSALTATALTSTSARLTWVDTCTYESGFRIERSLDGVTWTQVAIVSANAGTWTNYGLAAGTTYRYRVRAYEGSANGDATSPVTVTTP